jgi:hypothetical protein
MPFSNRHNLPSKGIDAELLEGAFVRHYLRADGAFGSEPLRYLDATPTQLATALGEDNGSEIVTQRVLSSFPSRADIVNAFSWGLPSKVHDDGPGWFRYLVLSCLIASISSDLADEGDYRERLKVALGFNTTILDLRGIALLWERLAKWCEKTRAEGRPFRKVILPDPGHMSHIGYTLRIAFPSRRDRDRFDNLAATQAVSLTGPTHVISFFRRQIDRYPWSEGFRAAFLEFEKRYHDGDRLLLDHAFWRVVEESFEPGRSSPIKEGALQLRFLVEIDESLQAEVSTGFKIEHDTRWLNDGSGGSMFSGSIEEVFSLIKSSESGRANIFRRAASEIDQGLLAFKENGWGCWSWWKDVDAGSLRVLIHDRLKLRSIQYCRSEKVSPNWWMSEAIGVLLYEQLAKSIGRAAPVSEHLKRLSIEGGVKTSGVYLGRKRLLPLLRAQAGSDAVVEPQRVELGELSIGESKFDTMSLTGSNRLSGTWRLSVVESDVSAPSELRVSFIDRAIVHHSLARPDVGNWVRDTEQRFTTEAILKPAGRPTDTHGQASEVISDLLEAVYAGGRGGWSEMDLLPLLSKIGGAQGPRHWDLLRSLRDAGWLEAWVAKGWRARRWYLSPAKLSAVSSAVALLGSASDILRDRFCNVATRLGGKVEIDTNGGFWCIPTPIAHFIDADELSQALGVEIVNASYWEFERAPKCWGSETYNIERRELASRWSWSEGGFRVGASGSTSRTRIERWIRSRGDANDLFRVVDSQSREAIFASRTSAILEAYRLSGAPLFERKGDRLIALTTDGRLPDGAAARIRMRHLSSPGPVEVTQGKFEYSYPVDDHDMRWITEKFGKRIVIDGRRSDDSIPTSRRIIRRERLFRARLSLGA